MYSIYTTMAKRANSIVDKWYKNAVATNDFSLTLSIVGLDITELPEIPDECEDLNISLNQLSIIKHLPRNLKHINASFNKISVLPEIPDGLITLDMYSNSIANLPKLPSSLRELNIGANLLYQIPEDLPNGLILLKAYYGIINLLPRLPVTLEGLYISDNAFTSLPPLDYLVNLKSIDYSNNSIDAMPALPSSLCYLRQDGNVFSKNHPRGLIVI